MRRAPTARRLLKRIYRVWRNSHVHHQGSHAQAAKRQRRARNRHRRGRGSARQPDGRGRQPDRAGVRPVARAEEKRRALRPQNRRGARLARLRARAEGAGARGTRRAGRRRLRLRARVHPVDVYVDRLPRDAVRRRRHDHREPPALQPQRAQVFRRGRRPGEPRHHRPAAHRRLPHARPGGPLQGAADPAALPLREQPAGKNPPGRRRGGL